MDIPHHIKYKKTAKISQWKHVFGLLLREGETYEMIYDKVQNTPNCQKCNTELCDGLKTNGRCMDHCHESGYFRMVLCRKCNAGYKREMQKNNTSGIRGINQRKDDGRWVFRAGRNPMISSKHKYIIFWTKLVYELCFRGR